VIVSSGAVASGAGPLGLKGKPRTIVQKQAAAAVGQQRLMTEWGAACSLHSRSVAQILLTADDLDHRARFLNARHTIEELLRRAAIPIINENDSVSFEEIKLGDNDHLSALVALLVRADLLVILSTAPGLLRGGPGGALVPVVLDISEARTHVTGHTSDVGTGGMGTKVNAAELVTANGIPAVIAAGAEPRVLARILQGDDVGTFFPTRAQPRGARQRWLGHSARARGSVRIDAGALRALIERGASLLPSGVTTVDGDFGIGAPIDVRAPDGTLVARGLTSYSSLDIARIMGRRASEIGAILGYSYADEVIHRDDLALLPGFVAPSGAEGHSE
jgi:glutamate 5-kinase